MKKREMARSFVTMIYGTSPLNVGNNFYCATHICIARTWCRKMAVCRAGSKTIFPSIMGFKKFQYWPMINDFHFLIGGW